MADGTLFAETPNLKVALEFAIERGQSFDALTIATVWSIWQSQSDLERGRALVRKALQLEDARNDADILRLRARVQRTVGILALGCHDIEEGQRALESARDLVRALGDSRGTAIADCDLAYVSYRSGNDKACGSYANLALAYFRSIDPVPHPELGWLTRTRA